MEKFFFWIFAAVAVLFGLSAVTRRRPLSCALNLVVSFVGLAGLYFQLHAPFPAALQIILYAGAIMVLVIFVLMFLNLPEDRLDRDTDVRKERLWPLVLVVPFGVVLVGLMQRVKLPTPRDVTSDFGSVEATGRALFEQWVYPFELVSLLLTVAIVGAVVIAKKRPT